MMMGGMGRAIDGSYAEYCLVPEKILIPINTDLPWEAVGALPEMLQTSYGSLVEGLNLKKDDFLLIRGGSSTVGLMAAIVAKQIGATVISTTRNPNKLASLKQYGVDYPILDNQDFASEVKKICPQGLDKALELVGTKILSQTMSLVKKAGKVCFTGGLSGNWMIKNFSPFMIPSGVFLTSYAGESKDLPSKIFNQILDLIAKKDLNVPIAKVYHGLDEIGQAQSNLESGKFVGKHVVVL